MSQYTFGPSETPVVMTGATSSAAGAAGYAPAPAAGDDAKYLKGDGTWDSPSSLPSVSGSDNGKVLQVSNGAWSAEDAISGFYTKPSGGIPNSDLATPPAVMTGATSSAAGASGYVPAPAAGDDDKFLAGDGTFKSGGKPMVILSYGNSTWNDFINAYNSNVIVYCRASSGSDPSSGSQTRMAFMAYVNNSETPTEVEFQYYRSMSSHSATAMGDEVYVYKLTNSNGGTWTVTTRKASIKEIEVASGSKLSVSWSSDKVTLSNTMTASDLLMTGATSSAAGTAGTVPAPAAGDDEKFLRGDGTWETVAGSSLYRQFWDDTNQIELDLDDDGKTYLVWCAASTAGTSGEIGDATYGALILVSDGKYSIVNKGSGITVTKSSDQLTISSTANIAMAIVEI